MKRKQKNSLKPRNGHMAAMKFRKSGAHTKTNKALRKLAKDVFRQQIRDAFAAGDMLSLFTSASPSFCSRNGSGPVAQLVERVTLNLRLAWVQIPSGPPQIFAIGAVNMVGVV